MSHALDSGRDHREVWSMWLCHFYSWDMGLLSDSTLPPDWDADLCGCWDYNGVKLRSVAGLLAVRAGPPASCP